MGHKNELRKAFWGSEGKHFRVSNGKRFMPRFYYSAGKHFIQVTICERLNAEKNNQKVAPTF
jgi:hypothetical protein